MNFDSTDAAPAAEAPLVHAPNRREFLGAALAAPAILTGCSKPDDWRTRVDGRWIGDNAALGHRVRDMAAHPPAGARERRCDVLVVGSGIAGLSAARALQRAGITDFAVLELEAQAGGNSRGHAMHALRCPLGAHYLPLPGPSAPDIQSWLLEIGLAKQTPAGLKWDERHLCHSPQERLFIHSHWQDGMLPIVARDSATQAQYRLFAKAIADAGKAGFALPTARAPWTPAHAALDATTAAQWLDAKGISDPLLRTYLDYSCRDDYGAGSSTVSAWALVHYFASRHGFSAPGDDGNDRDAVLTWPDGNAPLVDALRHPFVDRVHTGRAVFRIDEGLQDITAWAFDGAEVERWSAKHAIVATPLFIAAHVLSAPPAALVAAARQQRRAPWMVANLRLDALPLDRVGAPLSWDNVIHGSPSLGYVDAQHQSLGRVVGERLLTAYWAFPDTDRKRLLEMRWEDATQLILDDLRVVHPDLSERLQQVDIVRHGHAMAIPTPGLRSSEALAAIPDSAERISFAHADLSAYSVFEEAFTRGDAAGRRVARALGRVVA
ncbi:MAG: FAD-dependent oxidoreductase [Burkholderiaceae bacterium]